jgi:hypothetical protein
MNANYVALIQANIICILVFLVGMTAVAQHPQWFN